MVDTGAQSINNYWEPIKYTQSLGEYRLCEQIATYRMTSTKRRHV